MDSGESAASMPSTMPPAIPANFHDTPIQDVLPVDLLPYFDRKERCAGARREQRAATPTPEFLAWDHYQTLCDRIVRWAAGEI